MDTALILKQQVNSGEIGDFSQASPLLEKSELIKKLLAKFEFDILNLLNRLVELSEIPFSYRLAAVEKWVNKLADLSYCNDGFSITGKSDDMLSCYNSMITSVLIKMHYPGIERVEAGIDWILKYQNTRRGADNQWTGSRIQKYGGCMKATPCYIGVVKATVALNDYKMRPDYVEDTRIERKLKEGLNYILDHHVFKRLSDRQPITKDIDKLTYPFSYKTNLIEILRLLKHNNLFSDSRCDEAKDYLLKKKQKAGYWRVNSSYLPKCWVQFDVPKEPGLWISQEINMLVDQQTNTHD